LKEDREKYGKGIQTVGDVERDDEVEKKMLGLGLSHLS
jgi:hypothetical protein